MEFNWVAPIVISVLVFSLAWAWNKIKGQQSQIFYLDKWLQDIGHKVEHLEKELLEKKVIDTYYKSKEDLERERSSKKSLKEFDEELEDRLKKNEKEQKYLEKWTKFRKRR